MSKTRLAEYTFLVYADRNGRIRCRISTDKIKTNVMLYPHQKEQPSMAEFLDDVDEALEALVRHLTREKR